MFRIGNRDLPENLLTLAQRLVPTRVQPWSRAMIAELGVIDGFWLRLRWSLGSTTTLVRASLNRALFPDPGEERRLDVGLIAVYHFLFSATLVGLLTGQLGRITESWKYLVPALVMCYSVALLPAVFGLGLLLRDEAARIGTLVFTIAHLLLNLDYIRRGIAPLPELTAVRLAVDLLMIFLLNRQTVQRHFQLSPIGLDLNGKPLDRH